MAKGKGKWKKHLILLLGLPLLQMGYRMVSPVFEKTSSMKEEISKSEKTIAQIKQDSGSYSIKSEAEMAEREKLLGQMIPDQLFPKDVLRYFVTQFEKEHPLISFGNLTPQSPTASNVQADTENPAIKARVMRLQINAKMPSSLLVAYLDHMEKYPGVYLVQELTFNSAGEEGDALQMALGLDFYLSPKEWLPKQDIAARKVSGSPGPQGDGNVYNWFETSALELKPEPEPELDPDPDAGLPPPRQAASVKRFPPPSIPHVRFVGKSIVVGEDLFEEGDDIGGWKIAEINGANKLIVVKRGTLSRRLRFR